MNDKINRVLADRAQAFTTAEQKQARDNIGAQGSGDYVSATTFSAYTAHVESAKQDKSAMSAYIPFSSVSGSNSAISSINGSALSSNAGFSGVYTTVAFTGSGTDSSDRLGLNSSLLVSAEGDSRKAWYSFSGVYMQNSAGYTSDMTPTGVHLGTDLGGSTSHAWLKNGSVVFETPLPGQDWKSSYFAVGGIEAFGNFGSDNYFNNWVSAHWYQNTGDNGDGVWIHRGYHNGESSLVDPSITMYTPGNSATIHLSSISSWNNKLDNVNVGYGLSGNGKDVALGVTACSGEFIGIHSDYFYALTSRDLVFSSYDKDNSQLETKTVFNEYGMRMSANTAGRLVTLQDDGFRMQVDASSLTASLDHAKLRMSDSGGYADLTKSSIDAIAAVYNWATSQGMTPIN